MNKQDFEIFNKKINGEDLIYLDSAASAQMPAQVLAAVNNYYKNSHSNIHRGVHALGDEATQSYEDARKTVQKFINATYPEEVIFTKGTTESLNRVATWAQEFITEKDEILVSEFEHHSNLLPWENLSKKTGAKVVIFNLEDFKDKLNSKTKIVAITHASNVLGEIINIKKISKLAKKYNALVVVDGAQAAPHISVNVQSLGCDFYAFSGHKMMAPTGIGVLWGKKDLLEKMTPYEYGGGMVAGGLPTKHEAGTPNISGAVGLKAAIEYIENVGLENIQKHDQELLKYTFEKLAEIPGLEILGTKNPENKTGLISFVIKDIDSHDIAAVLSARGVCVRAGQHCASLLHEKLGIKTSVRASFYIYNSKKDIDKFIEGLKHATNYKR